MFNLYANVYSVRSKRSHLIGCLEFLLTLTPQEGILLKVKEKTLVYPSVVSKAFRSKFCSCHPTEHGSHTRFYSRKLTQI